MTSTAPRLPPLRGGTYPWRGDVQAPRATSSPGGALPRVAAKLPPVAYGGGTTQAWGARASDDATSKLFPTCLALVSASAGLIHLAAAVPHFEESAVHGAFFVGTGLAQLAGAALLVLWPRRSVLVATACANGLIVALWAMSRAAGVPVEPHPWTPEPVGITDLVATLLEVGLVIGAVMLAMPSGGSAVTRPGPREPRWWLAAAGTLAVLVTGVAMMSAIRSGGHGHSTGSSERQEAGTVGRAAAPGSAPVDQTQGALGAPAVETSPAPGYQPPTPAVVPNQPPGYQPPVAAVAPQPAPAIEPPAPVVEQPPVATQPEPPPTHPHEGDAHHEHQ
jgi:hypothetical protein